MSNAPTQEPLSFQVSPWYVLNPEKLLVCPISRASQLTYLFNRTLGNLA